MTRLRQKEGRFINSFPLCNRYSVRVQKKSQSIQEGCVDCSQLYSSLGGGDRALPKHAKNPPLCLILCKYIDAPLSLKGSLPQFHSLLC